MDKRLIHFWHVFDTSVVDTFSHHFIHISYNLDMIFYHQPLFDTFECIKVYFDTLLSVSKLYQKWIKRNKNKVFNFDRLQSVSKFSQERTHTRNLKVLTFFFKKVSLRWLFVCKWQGKNVFSIRSKFIHGSNFKFV